jgi:threonine synthase
VSFETAVKKGLPDDNGLFMPEKIDPLGLDFFNNLPGLSLSETGFAVLHQFVGDEIPENDLRELISEAFSFETPLVELTEDIYALELFHGPTLAFKDIGARFMARVLGFFNQRHSDRVTVLVATSGDTGSAVANGFLGVKNVEVCILYPKGKVSGFQEQQMTTLGQNIHVLEVEGTFDDCQRLVKSAFLDKTLTDKLGLTSANSINVARLLPQAIYYFYAWSRLAELGKPIVFSIPSGNYGNLTAGLIARRLGLPITHFIAACNANNIVPHYLQTGDYVPKPSVSTISNAMDVGDPSNFVRMKALFHGHLSEFQHEVTGYSFSDDETRQALSYIYRQTGYTADPHGAVGFLGLQRYLGQHDAVGVFLETAHPIKFKEVVEAELGFELTVPESLQLFLGRKKKVSPCPADFDGFKEAILGLLN